MGFEEVSEKLKSSKKESSKFRLNNLYTIILRLYKEDKAILDLKDYIKRHDYFRFYNTDQKTCICYKFICYGYCKHYIYIEKINYKEEDQISINLDFISKKRGRGRPKLDQKFIELPSNSQ